MTTYVITAVALWVGSLLCCKSGHQTQQTAVSGYAWCLSRTKLLALLFSVSYATILRHRMVFRVLVFCCLFACSIFF